MIVNTLNNKFLKALAMLGLLLFCACNKKVSMIHLTGRTMGTQYNVKYYTSDKLDDKVKTQEQIDEVLKKVNQEMSTYLKDSEISYFNQTDRLGWLKISPDFFRVTTYALQLAHESEGAFDPTIGPLVNLWGFGPGGTKKVPKSEEIEEALKRVGYDKINLNKERTEIKKKVPGVYLDLSALAKGFGVDKVGDFLEDNEIKNYMVEIGGEVRTKGKKSDSSLWKIAIEAPHPTSQGESYQRILGLNSLSLATSGNYRNFFMENGKKYSHTINVGTGKPVAHSLAS
ncbi:MAG: FAD:protein FMN transferase, partial [Halobacteriovoraceae bacterium]|nr:FAD:protein FMN transferase [Halobacteriovoraceae bacterium]